MTAAVVTPYCHDLFQKVEDIHPSNEAFQSRNGEKLVKEIARSIVKKHELEATFGAILIHRHFDLQPDQRLVEFNNITMPWKSSHKRSDNEFLPTSWMLDTTTNKWMPYEFKFNPLGREQGIDLNEDKYADFLHEYTMAVKTAGLEKAVGLRQFPGAGFVGGLEVTEGNANVFLLPGEASQPPIIHPILS